MRLCLFVVVRQAYHERPEIIYGVILFKLIGIAAGYYFLGWWGVLLGLILGVDAPGAHGHGPGGRGRDVLEAGGPGGVGAVVDGVVVLQVVPKPLPDLPKVPLAISYAKTDEARKLIEVGIYAASIFSWPFVLPPDTPKEQVQVLAKAFTDTLKDEELLAEAEQAKLDIKPISASDLEKTVASIFKLDNTMLSKLTDIFFK